MFSKFDFSILNDPDFKEDSVREELILPIIKNLGYDLSGEGKIIRSKSLIHPYVAIGSKQRKVSIIPDYLFLHDGQPFWILDAKSPTEKITKSKHVEQAYSYAIHPEVRAEYYALCNGKYFILYNIKKFEPLLYFKLSEINKHWNTLYRLLNYSIKAKPEMVSFLPDFGLYLKKMGVQKGFKYIAFDVQSDYIVKIEDNLYSVIFEMNGLEDESNNFLVSADFNKEQLKSLLSIIPVEISDIISSSLTRQPYKVAFKQNVIKFGVVASLSDNLQSNAEESYVPFIVDEFMKWLDMSDSSIATDPEFLNKVTTLYSKYGQ